MENVTLVLNAGSSSLKFSIFAAQDPARLLFRGQLAGLPAVPRFIAHDAAGNVIGQQVWPSGTRLEHHEAIEHLLAWCGGEVLGGVDIVAVGHRVVHGGLRFTGPVLIDDGVLEYLETLIPLAPLHQAHHLAVMRAVRRFRSRLPQVACFDTSFHRTQPLVAQTFALPRKYAEEGVRRYGFHGLSFEYIASALPGIDARAAAGRTIVAHLGNGASLCALQAGRSVATTMGLTPVDGLVMGTRCGAIDPGVLLYLMHQHGMGAREMEQLLYHQSGLLGVSGISSDMRTLLASSDPHAAEAVALFVYRIVREIGSLTAALGGLDAVVFTGGIGENAAVIRSGVMNGLAWLGLKPDELANATGEPRLSDVSSTVAAWVVPTNEELMIARHTRVVLDSVARRSAS